MSPRSNRKSSFGQRPTLEKHVTSMSCKLEPAIWSHDTGQQIPYFDRCQLIITWMSDIKEVHGKPGLHVSVNLLLEYGRHVARLHRRCRRRRCAYAPTSNTASHGTHEKINSWVPFSSLIWVWGSAWPPELRYYFGFVSEEIFDIGHTIKSCCLAFYSGGDILS